MRNGSVMINAISAKRMSRKMMTAMLSKRDGLFSKIVFPTNVYKMFFCVVILLRAEFYFSRHVLFE